MFKSNGYDYVGNKLWDCKEFLRMNIMERSAAVVDNKCCAQCLFWSHQQDQCDQKTRFPCDVKEGGQECGRLHHRLLHGTKVVSLNHGVTRLGKENIGREADKLPNPDQEVLTYVCYHVFPNKVRGIIFFDDGSSHNLITHKFARILRLKGEPVTQYMQVTGQDFVEHKTMLYSLPLIDNKGEKHIVYCFGLNSLTSDLERVNVKFMYKIFPMVPAGAAPRRGGHHDRAVCGESAPHWWRGRLL